MYSRIVRLAFVLTSVAPIFLSLAFVSFKETGISTKAIGLFCMATVLFLGCFLLAKYGAKHLEVFSEKIEGIKSADAEVPSFLLAYFLPFLINIETLPDYATSIYIVVVFCLVLYNSNCLYFSPILGILGYHLYEVTFKSGVTCVLLTRRTLRGIPKEVRIVRLAEYVLLEKG